MVNITIDGKKFVLRHSFKLPNVAGSFEQKELAANPEKFEAELNALLAIEGQNVLVPEEVIEEEKKKAAARKRANSKTKK